MRQLSRVVSLALIATVWLPLPAVGQTGESSTLVLSSTEAFLEPGSIVAIAATSSLSGETIRPDEITWSPKDESVVRVTVSGQLAAAGWGRTTVVASRAGLEPASIDVVVAPSGIYEFAGVLSPRNRRGGGLSVSVTEEGYVTFERIGVRLEVGIRGCTDTVTTTYDATRWSLDCAGKMYEFRLRGESEITGEATGKIRSLSGQGATCTSNGTNVPCGGGGIDRSEDEVRGTLTVARPDSA
jgi:hypothetical protein